MTRRWRFLLAALLFVTAFLNDPPWKTYGRQQFFGIQSEPLRVALNIAHEGEFANPFHWMPTGPTAHTAPAYPYIAGALIKMFGEGPNGWLAIRVLATAALAMQLALLPWVARVFGFAWWTGVMAAAIGLLMKPAKEELWETHLAGLAILLLAVEMYRGRGAQWIAGVAFLLQPVIAAAYYAWAIPRRRVWMLVIPLAICLPWIVRNYVVLGGLTFVRDDLGIELAVSFNDCTPYGIRESEKTGCFLAQHPNTSREGTEELRELGEIEYNRRRMSEGAAWVAANPVASLSLVAQRAWYFWFPSDYGLAHYAQQRKRMWIGHAATVLSFVGLWIALRRRVAGAKVLGLWLAVFPLIYYLMQFEERYRDPILWITWLLAAYAGHAFYHWALYSRRDDHTARISHH